MASGSGSTPWSPWMEWTSSWNRVSSSASSGRTARARPPSFESSLDSLLRVPAAKVLGIDPAKEPLKVKAAIGIVPEVESPPSYLTATEYLYFVGRIRDVANLQQAID